MGDHPHVGSRQIVEPFSAQDDFDFLGGFLSHSGGISAGVGVVKRCQ